MKVKELVAALLDCNPNEEVEIAIADKDWKCVRRPLNFIIKQSSLDGKGLTHVILNAKIPSDCIWKEDA